MMHPGSCARNAAAAALGVVVLAAASALADTKPVATAAAGDFQAAMSEYRAGHYRACAAYAANGRFHDATAQQQLAIEKARVLDWNTRTMSERLDAYRHGTALRGALFVTR